LRYTEVLTMPTAETLVTPSIRETIGTASSGPAADAAGDEVGEQGVEGGDDTRSGVVVDGRGVGMGDCHWWPSRSEMLCV
jgi:hypothetical protein